MGEKKSGVAVNVSWDSRRRILGFCKAAEEGAGNSKFYFI